MAMTLTTICTAHLDWYKTRRAPASFKARKGHCANIQKHIGEAIAEKLRPYNVYCWLDANPQWGQASRRQAIIALQAVLNWAVKYDMIDRNPIDKKIEKPPMPSRGGELCLSAWDTVLVIDASPKDFKQAMEFMYLTGARPQVIYLAEARHYNRQAKCLVLDDHKTKAHQQNLVVHLCPKAIAIVEELVAKHPTGKLFRRRHGGNWNSHHITTRIATIRRRLPLVKNIFARGARHTYAVDALKSGVKVETVASLLGHKGIGMVMTHYAPLTTLAEQAQDALKRFRN